MAKSATIHPMDAHIGKRIRLRRSSTGIAQRALARSLGVTFQQLEKYEKGINRVSCSKLYEVAKILKVQIGYFFEGYEKSWKGSGKDSPSDQPLSFFESRDAVNVATAYHGLDKKSKKAIKEVIKVLAAKNSNKS